MALHKYLLGLLAFAVATVFMISMVTNMGDNYGVDVGDADFIILSGNASLILDETDDLTERQHNLSLGGEINEEATEDSMFKGAFRAIRLVSGSFGLVSSIIFLSANKIGIPSFFVTAAITALTIFITFSLVYIVFRIAKGAD